MPSNKLRNIPINRLNPWIPLRYSTPSRIITALDEPHRNSSHFRRISSSPGLTVLTPSTSRSLSQQQTEVGNPKSSEIRLGGLRDNTIIGWPIAARCATTLNTESGVCSSIR